MNAFRSNVKLAAAVFLTCLVFGVANVYADALRTKTGAALTYSLNGVAIYKGSIRVVDAGYADNSTTAITGATSFTLDNTAFVTVQCNDAAYVVGRKLAGYADAGAVADTSMLRVDQFEKYLVGSLLPDSPGVSVAPTDAGTVTCKVFEIR